MRNIFPFVDPEDKDNFETRLVWSSAHKQPQFLPKFYARCNPEAALEHAQENHLGLEPLWTAEEIQMLVEYDSAEQQRNRLEKVVGKTSIQSVRKSNM